MVYQNAPLYNHPNENLKKVSDQKIEDIIKALDFLKEEAQKCGNEDIHKLIDSTFNICLHTYCMIKRYEMDNFLKAAYISRTKQS